MWEAITILFFSAANLSLAYFDSRQIFKKRKILHGLNGLLYIGLISVPLFIFHNYWLIGALLFNRLLVFNISLSLFRNLDWDYISPERKAITDKIAFFFFKYNGKLMYIVYAGIFIALTVISFL